MDALVYGWFRAKSMEHGVAASSVTPASIPSLFVNRLDGSECYNRSEMALRISPNGHNALLILKFIQGHSLNTRVQWSVHPLISGAD